MLIEIRINSTDSFICLKAQFVRLLREIECEIFPILSLLYLFRISLHEINPIPTFCHKIFFAVDLPLWEISRKKEEFTCLMVVCVQFAAVCNLLRLFHCITFLLR